ncbi:MAG: rRNA methyltransferase [Chitinophagaceae bacterium]
MSVPFFYIQDYDGHQLEIVLDEENSKHAVQVLRMKKGEKLNVTDGNGNLIEAIIIDDHKKHCKIKVVHTTHHALSARQITIAISLLKNSSRFEWFLEKSTELGIQQIIPLVCGRTEKQKFRSDRLENILVSAMLQSQQCWLPLLHQPVKFEKLFEMDAVRSASQKFIAHCIEQKKRNLADLVNDSLPSQIILIGPEGDFTKEEIDLALQHHFDTVSLGETRLRAETAGMVAATILKLV